MRNKLAALALLLAAFLPLQAHAAACTTGQLTCNNDTINDSQITAAIRDPTVQLRVLYQYLAYCFANVWNEAASTPGNLSRVSYCNQIMAGGVEPQRLVAAIMNATITGEILSGTCPAFPGPTPQTPNVQVVQGQAAGCMVNIDIGNAIATLLTVTVSTASTIATQATVGSNNFVVASANGVAKDQTIYAVGVPPGSTVAFVTGTTVYFTNSQGALGATQGTTAALSATPVAFSVSTGLPK